MLSHSDLIKYTTGDVFLQWMEIYGPVYQLRFPTDNRIITFEPDHIKAILATQFDAFDKGPILYEQFTGLLGTGVFNSDGDMWKFHRSMTRPFFSRERISHFDIFEAHADDALRQAAKRLAAGHPIDFQDLVSRFTLDSATEFLFGHNVDSLAAGLPYPENSHVQNSPSFLNHSSNIFVDAFLAGQILSSLRTRVGPSWPLAEFWHDKIVPLRKIMDRFTEPLLVQALAKKAAQEKDNKTEEDSDTLLTHLVNHTQDINVLKDELLNLLVAGRDTTACALTYAFYMLAEHPKIADRLRQEIFAKVGPSNRPTYDDMREMKYLRAFINGACPDAPVLMVHGRGVAIIPTSVSSILDFYSNRMSCKAAIWTSKTPGSKPYYVPANTRILYSIFNMHRRTDLWGPDALVFDPDRFLDERLHKYLTPNPYIFCPFNAGPRICLGQQFAYHETSFFLVRLLQQFTGFALAPDAQPEWSKPPAKWAECGGRKATEKVAPGIHLTMYAKGGLWARMEGLTK
ncbi:cytochrome P450 [Crassisporium funariophilum]|nr:cytochrome P450 [Crassisporium funariophilum]